MAVGAAGVVDPGELLGVHVGDLLVLAAAADQGRQSLGVALRPVADEQDPQACLAAW